MTLDIDTKISYFASTYKTEVKGEISIFEMLEQFEDGTYKDLIEAHRNDPKSGAKQKLPTFAVHGHFRKFRKKDNFTDPTGIVILDIDDINIDVLTEYKNEIVDTFDSVFCVMTSPSGNGLKVLYYIDSDIVTADNYKLIGRELASMFAVYGKVDYLSVTDCLIATHDPELIVNEEAVPDRIMITEPERIAGELEPRDESIDLFDDAEEFFETALYESIANITNNNFHFIQVSILDLKKYGFSHPEHDLSFVIDMAEELFKRSSDNKNRFNECVEIAKGYPQLKWAYNYSTSGLNEDEAIDYSDFQPIEYAGDNERSEVETTKESIEVDDNDDIDGLVNYEELFNKTLETLAEGDRVGFEISLSNFAEIFRLKGTGILTVTGIPSHGKTEFVDQMTLDLARLYGHQSLIAGFEQEIPEHIVKLIRRMVGFDVRVKEYRENPANLQTIKSNFNFITEHFKHIDVRKVKGNVNTLLKTAAKIIQTERQKGNDLKYFVIDPFNMLSSKTKTTGHEKIEEILRAINEFSHAMDVLVILVAHPYKMKINDKTKQYDVPDFYSVKGSSAFFEMSYHGLVVYRNSDNTVLVRTLKVKQNNLGRKDQDATFFYDIPSGRYYPIDEELNEMAGDHRQKHWLKKVL